MKVIGIEIYRSRVIFYALQLDDDNNIINLTGDFKSLTLINPDAIAIITRQSKGRFKATPISFKIEGVLQVYDKVDIEFISPHTIAAYHKKNPFNISVQHSYQESAAKLANYLVNRK